MGITDRIEAQIAEEAKPYNANWYANDIMKRLQEGASTKWREIFTPEMDEKWLQEHPGIGPAERMMGVSGAHIQVGEHDYALAWIPHTLELNIVRDGIPFEPTTTYTGPQRDDDIKAVAGRQLRKDLKEICETVQGRIKDREIRLCYMDEAAKEPVITTVKVNLNAPKDQQYSWHTVGQLGFTSMSKEQADVYIGQFVADTDPLIMAYGRLYDSAGDAYFTKPRDPRLVPGPQHESIDRDLIHYPWIVQRESPETMNALQQCLTPGTRLVGFSTAAGAGTEVPKGVRGESTSIKGFINRAKETFGGSSQSAASSAEANRNGNHL